MRKLRLTTVGLGVIALVLSGCATSTAAESSAGETVSASAGPTAPEGVDLAAWDDVVGAQVIEANVAGPTTIDAMVQESDLIVIGRVTDQGPFPDHDVIATQSSIEILDVLKGEKPNLNPNLYTIGKPIYLEGYYDVEGLADPPLVGEVYLFLLSPYPDIPNAKGDLVARDNVWITLGHGAFLKNPDDQFVWDGEIAIENTTIDDVRTLLD